MGGKKEIYQDVRFFHGAIQLFFYNGIRALENRWTKFMSVAGNYVE